MVEKSRCSSAYTASRHLIDEDLFVAHAKLVESLHNGALLGVWAQEEGIFIDLSSR